MACPTTGIRDFPLLNSFIPSEELNNKIQEVYLTDLKWSPRNTAPRFIEPIGSGLLDEGGSYATSPTTMRLNENEYTLTRVQICTPLHTNFILPSSNEPQKRMEILLMFQNSGGNPLETFLTLCVPVLETATPIKNEYIEALVQDKLPGQPIPASSLLPPPGQQQFLSYGTCLSTTGQQRTSRSFMRVLYFVKGIFLNPETIQELQGKRLGVSIQQLRLQNDVGSLSVQVQRIQNITGVISPNITTVEGGINYILSLPLPQPQLLGGSLAQRQNQLLTRISDESSYLSFLAYSQLDTKAGSASPTRTDSTDSYKCVPLNPSTDVQNGQLEVNLETGELLSKVLDKTDAAAERRLQKKEGLTPGQVERVVAIAIGVVFGVILIGLVAYVIARATSSGFTQPYFEMPAWLKMATPVLFVGVAAGVGGYFIGTAA